MFKREVGPSNDVVDQEGPRAKRRKNNGNVEDVTMSDPTAQTDDENGGATGGSPSRETAKAQGLELWHIIKNAVNKEGRILSPDFLRRPSKRQYPDYYDLVQQPISLEEIKKQLDAGGYNSLEAVKHDLMLCFSNAKQYNMKNSDIWKDAKFLNKLVIKEYNKMSGSDARDEDEAGEQGDPVDGEGDDDRKKEKNKPPNMNRLLKSRLQKLVNKTDDTGRVISTEFMELPSKKDWPFYYKEIKRPQCIENIFKHLKRKEYLTSLEFATDVELVFSNAMAFNQEHTAIWEDALLLRDYFRQLMSDLPPPYALPEYTKPSNGKFKLKMPASAQPSVPTSPPALAPAQPPANTSGSLLLRVPATQIKTQVSLATSPPAAIPTPPAASSMPLPTTQAQSKTTKASATPQPSTQSLPHVNAAFAHHYPNASYQPPVVASTALTNATPSSSSSHLPAANPVQASRLMSDSPAPVPIHPNHQLKLVSLKTEPRGRPFTLDYREGVKSWMMRLGHREKGLCVARITFLGQDEDESGGEEEQEEQIQDKEEEEDEEEAETEVPKKKGKRGRGRPKGSTVKAGKTKATRAAKKPSKAPVPKLDEVQVKLNGSVVKEKEDHEREWYVELPVGSNVVEIGEKGGLMWKVYAERIADLLL